MNEQSYSKSFTLKEAKIALLLLTQGCEKQSKMCKVFLLKNPTQRLNGKKLTDLIKTKHNSNHKTHQTTLKYEFVIEFTYYVLGFVPADVVRLKRDVWFSKLSNEQITSVDKFLESNKRAWD